MSRLRAVTFAALAVGALLTLLPAAASAATTRVVDQPGRPQLAGFTDDAWQTDATADMPPGRTIRWSGHTWHVRDDASHGEATGPGPNHWSASARNVRVDRGDLVLSIARDARGRWASAEIDNLRHLGYGTYRWVVETDLSRMDPDDVLGMFVYGPTGPSHNEIDIEASHWGDPDYPTGSGTVWQDADRGRHRHRPFRYSRHAPYTNQFTWTPGRVRYRVTDATGAVLFAWTVTRGVPVPSDEAPAINYWRMNGIPATRTNSIRLSAFDFKPPPRRRP